jgi:hypothetical protein
MRAFVNLLEKLIDGARLIIGLFMLTIMMLGLLLPFGASHLMPEVENVSAEVAARGGERPLTHNQKQRLAEDMAKDGWSYGAATATTGQRKPNDGWAD